MMLQPISTRANVLPLAPQATDDVERIWSALSHLEKTYPGFRMWFWGRVVRGLETGQRKYFLSTEAADLVGIVIAKRDRLERKLCTVWVRSDRRGCGLATGLIDEASDWLEEDRPLLTVPQERLAEFMPLVWSRGYKLSEALSSFYRPNVTEYVFNGRLRLGSNG